MHRFLSLGAVMLLPALLMASPAYSRSGMADPGRMRADEAARPAANVDGLATLGQGSLTWLGIPVYDAALWGDRGDFLRWGFDQRLALRIDYHRNIKSSRLTETTRREWQRLEKRLDLPAEARRERWLAQAEAIWPDVAPGDYIMTVVEPDGACHFFGPDGLLGVIEDPDFGPAFLSIWLHPRTSRPDLRAALIGISASEG